MRKDRTTDLGLIKLGHPYTWGKVEGIHDLGRYTFVIYNASITNEPGRFHQEQTVAVYVDGKDTHVSYSSLDSAMLGAVACGRLEANEARYMAMAAAKLMEIKQ